MDRIVCPTSLGHVDETLDAEAWEVIQGLQEDLSLGISFVDQRQIEYRGTMSAVADFCGEPPLYSMADEAFEHDPQTPRDDLAPGGVRVVANLGPARFRSDEVAHEKSKEATLQKACDDARQPGHDSEEQAAAEYEAMVDGVLGPLVDPDGYAARVARKKAALLSSSWTPGPGTPISKYTAVAQQGLFADALRERYPAMGSRWGELAVSDELAHMPALRYPALFRAAIVVRRGRKAHAGDGYDIAHLTRGLSRCDIVTADGSMTQIARERRLIPAGCQLFRTAERHELHTAVQAALAAVGEG